MDDTARQAPPTTDAGRRIPIKDVLLLFRAAGLPRDIRSVQRYCENGLLDGIKELTATGETWFVSEDSIEPAITQLKQMHAAKGGQTTTPPVVSPVVAAEPASITEGDDDGLGATSSDTAGRGSNDVAGPEPATDDDVKPDVSGHVAQLEKRLEDKDNEIDFLRGEIATKNQQLTDASERDRETNVLIQGLQSMVLQLTGKDRPIALAENGTIRTARVSDASTDLSADDREADRPATG